MRVLILDDDREFCEELSEFLRADGHAVHTASDGFLAARLAFESSHDLLLLDFHVPGVNRTGLIQMMKRKNPHLKIFIVTGNPSAESLLARENLSGCVDKVMYKPLPAETLLNTLAA